MNFFEQAKKKLEAVKSVKGQKENAMLQPVREALIRFCKQDEEFAQAVAQGGSLEDCMRAVANGVGNHISDLVAYRKAVQFYFEGAEVVFQMKIDVCPNRVGGGDGDGIVLDLMSFM